MRGGGGAGLAAAKMGGAGHRSRDGTIGGGGGASLDIGGEDWEGLALQDTPIRGVGVTNSSPNRGTAASQSLKTTPSGGG